MVVMVVDHVAAVVRKQGEDQDDDSSDNYSQHQLGFRVSLYSLRVVGQMQSRRTAKIHAAIRGAVRDLAHNDRLA